MTGKIFIPAFLQTPVPPPLSGINWRDKPIEHLDRDELLIALKQACLRVAELEGRSGLLKRLAP